MNPRFICLMDPPCLANMQKLILRHKESVSRFTNLDFEAIDKVKYLFEFDRQVQTVCWGYPTESSYYRDASSSDSVLAIRIPFFAIQAADDPVWSPISINLSSS